MIPFRFGFGYDVHQLVPDRKLIVGGIYIPHDKGALGHSDADVLIHAIIDALFGALALGDIGSHFPDTDPRYKDIASSVLLEEALAKITHKGYLIGNIDATVVLQTPKLKTYLPRMINYLSTLLDIESGCISIKATTTEHLGFVGEEKGISAYAVVGLYTQSI